MKMKWEVPQELKERTENNENTELLGLSSLYTNMWTWLNA